LILGRSSGCASVGAGLQCARAPILPLIMGSPLVIAEYAFTPMTEAFAREIVAWRYPGQYDIYNTDDADVEADVQVLLDPRYAYYAVTDSAGFLVGFCCYGI